MSSRSSLHPLRFATLRLSLQLLDPSAISLRLCKGVGRRSHEVPRGTNFVFPNLCESVSAWKTKCTKRSFLLFYLTFNLSQRG